ncbi:hypothetical protein POJ06DRAFT_271673 [Lipomyces tetrasporus]|uniref:Uncharacterized protein n=1 Tax=Lipomyces tetrasporus TaxID=54092 RepID=A0AAD7QMJ4_9ASCO|nr:uncharacterized protein POJ06DRAFT_271673 [Lipomyces tetrasporus]KAJ8096647.1 hypothetical protein POJ06DRAFT_271673 [Lipomyces tetrasporus]
MAPPANPQVKNWHTVATELGFSVKDVPEAPQQLAQAYSCDLKAYEEEQAAIALRRKLREQAEAEAALTQLVLSQQTQDLSSYHHHHHHQHHHHH